MDKHLSIVLVDKRPYRKIAQENWGLTDGQMKGKHVHHRIRRSKGGTNDASNLYVCSPSFHRWGWHDGEEWIEWAEMGAKKAHKQKDADGKSLTAKKAGEASHRNRNAEGKSIHALETITKLHEDKDELGRSKISVKGAEKLNRDKDEKGRSVNAVKGAEKMNEILHKGKNGEGKSEHAVRMGEAAHKEKTEEGKSEHAVAAAKKLNSGKDEEGKSSNAIKGGKAAASQIWQSSIDGFVSSASNVAQHNKARGWDPNARVKIGVKPMK
jgi:hypothetical protein